VLNVFIIDQMRRAGVVSPTIAWPLVAFAIVIIVGYQARTAWVMLAGYYATSLYYRWRHIDFVRVLPLVLLGLGAVFVIAFLALSGEDIERLGSGRMASYILRMEILSNRDWGPLLFGSGPDTDKFRTAVWWWEAKGAHNDYLHAGIETGLVGVLALIIFLVALYSKLPVFGKPLFFSLIASSALSNGLLGRPTLGIYLFLAASVSISLSARLGMAGSTRFR
jgi:O-antigen ligase